MDVKGSFTGVFNLKNYSDEMQVLAGSASRGCCVKYVPKVLSLRSLLDAYKSHFITMNDYICMQGWIRGGGTRRFTSVINAYGRINTRNSRLMALTCVNTHHAEHF